MLPARRRPSEVHFEGQCQFKKGFKHGLAGRNVREWKKTQTSAGRGKRRLLLSAAAPAAAAARVKEFMMVVQTRAETKMQRKKEWSLVVVHAPLLGKSNALRSSKWGGPCVIHSFTSLIQLTRA